MTDGFKPTLAIVFLAVKQDKEPSHTVLMMRASLSMVPHPMENLQRRITAGKIAIMLLEVNRAYFSILFEDFPEKNYRKTTRKMAKKHSKNLRIPAFSLPAVT